MRTETLWISSIPNTFNSKELQVNQIQKTTDQTITAENHKEGRVLTESRAELCRQRASGDGEDRRLLPAIQPQVASGGRSGRQAGTSDLDEPDAQGGRLCVGTNTVYSLEMQNRYMGMEFMQFPIRHVH